MQKAELGTKLQNRTTTVTILKHILITEAYVGMLGVKFTVSSSCIYPSRVWEHGNKAGWTENKKICKPSLPRIHGALLRKNIWSSDILRKIMQRDKWRQNNFPVLFPKNTSLKNIFNRHSLTVFKTLFPKFCNTLTTSGHFLKKKSCNGKTDSSDSIQNMYL